MANGSNFHEEVLRSASRFLNGPILTLTVVAGVCLNLTAITVFMRSKNGPRIKKIETHLKNSSAFKKSAKNYKKYYR